MTGPQTLSRPLAARMADMPAPRELASGPAIPQAVIDAAIQALDECKTKYTDRPGILPLRTWVSNYLKERFDVELSPDVVTITCGGTEARFVTVKHLAPFGTQIVCPGDPNAITGAAHLAGVSVVAQTNDPATVSVLYLTPNDPQIAVDDVLKQAAAYGWWIVWDVGGTDATSFHPAQNSELAQRTVTLGSLSDRLPGWRLGWLAGSEQALKLRAYKQSMTICSTSVSQWAALGLDGEA